MINLKTLLACLLLAPLSAWAQVEGVQYEWEDKRNKDDILIQTSSGGRL